MNTPTQLTVKPEDFPRGFAETNDELQPILLNLEGTAIFDAGIADYGEFFTSLSYGWHMLQTNTVPFDTGPGRVSIACRFLNAVQLKWTPLTSIWRWPK